LVAFVGTNYIFESKYMQAWLIAKPRRQIPVGWFPNSTQQTLSF